MSTTQPDIDTLKDRLKATWNDGDYGLIAKGMERSAGEFLDRVSIAPGERLLDVACGAGQLAIPAARSGARVTGIDISENWIDQARGRARSEGLETRFDVGDVESMPYEDGSFDVVVSLIGAMFAPRPQLALQEMMRVCRPGGRIVMGNWTPEGFVGSFFKLVGQHVPPPDMPSPLLWGDEATVRERFAAGVSELELTREFIHFDYPFSPADIADHYFRYFGPTKKAFEALDENDREAFRTDVRELWSGANGADNGSTQVDAEILRVVAVLE